MKIDITPAQLKAIKDMADSVNATIGVDNSDYNRESRHQVKMVDAMLKRNNLTPRDYE